MKEKRINDIKVTEITDALNIHRTTFYQYFDSINDLGESINDRLFATNLQPTPGNIADNKFKHLYEANNADFMSLLLENPGKEPAFDSQMKKLLDEELLYLLDKMNINYRKEDLPYYVTFMQSGLPGLTSWVLKGESSLTDKQISYIFDQLEIRSIYTIHNLLAQVQQDPDTLLS